MAIDKEYIFIKNKYFIEIEKSNFSNDLYIFQYGETFPDYVIKVNSYIITEERDGYKIDVSKLESYPLKATKYKNREAGKRYKTIPAALTDLKEIYQDYTERENSREYVLYIVCVYDDTRGKASKLSGEYALEIGFYNDKKTFITKELNVKGTSYNSGDHRASNNNLHVLKNISVEELEDIKKKLSYIKDLESDLYNYTKEASEFYFPKHYKTDLIRDKAHELHNIHEKEIELLKAYIMEEYNKLFNIEGLFYLDKEKNISFVMRFE